MDITFDKRNFDKLQRWVSQGVIKYARKQAFMSVLFNIPVYAFILFILKEDSTEINILNYLLLASGVSFISFIPYYFLYKYNFKNIKSIYNNSVDYWEKHDPSFFEGEKYEKIEN